MRAALDWVFRQEPRPDFLIQAGFAGALHESMAIGKILQATEVVDATGRTWPVPFPIKPADTITGRLLTMPRLIGDPVEKASLGKQYAALAVDMETSAFAEVCSRHNVSFACLRAISDEVHTALSPRLLKLLSGANASWWRMLLGLLTSPRLIGECWRLAKHTRIAADRLGEVLRDMISE
jgi:nucleoside phosphorylase